MRNAVPVLYYHRVNNVDRRMAVSPDLFQAQMQRLKDKGWRSLGTAELKRFIETGDKPAAKCLVITFDDGFADNLYYAFPILQRAGLKAVIFLITERVGEGEPRQLKEGAVPPIRSFDEANKAALKGDLDDYLRASEIRALARSGLVEFGSHTLSHRPCFQGPEIERFILSSSPHWARQVLAQGDLRPGVPLYEWASQAAVPCFRPDPLLKEKLVEFAKERGGPEAIRKEGKNAWTARLKAEAARLREEGDRGTMESKEEAGRRIGSELRASRAAVEKLTGAPCPALCWPWGHYSALSLTAAEQAGYALAFTTETGSITRDTEPLALRRLRVSASTGPRALETMLSALSTLPGSYLAQALFPSRSRDRDDLN
jgi:hypothetical protein